MILNIFLTTFFYYYFQKKIILNNVIITCCGVTTTCGAFSPRSVFKGFASGSGVLCLGFGWLLYHCFRSYFFVKKSRTLCSSFVSGSGGALEFHNPNHVSLQT